VNIFAKLAGPTCPAIEEEKGKNIENRPLSMV
jgi:hypothetical protein